MSALTQKDLLLEARKVPLCKCGDPECASNGLSFHPACHPEGGLKVVFGPLTGNLSLRCHVCGTVVVQVAVSPGAADA